MTLHHTPAGDLNVAYLEFGEASGPPVVLLHGFPYDVHAFDEVAPRLAAAGARVIVPWLRGFGPTRFLDQQTPRSGQQAALGRDLLALLDALEIPKATVGGYDWGGRAACIVAALWPERVHGLVTVNGYNIQDIARASEPQSPDMEQRLWYQYYFHSERGRAGLTQDRRALCRLLWQLWSPSWSHDDSSFARSAASFDNPDFVEVVIHSYRHRFGLVEGDSILDPFERRLATLRDIHVPTISLDGADDGVMTRGGNAHHAARFTGAYQYRLVPGVGHNLPQEAPEAFVRALLELMPPVAKRPKDRFARPGPAAPASPPATPAAGALDVLNFWFGPAGDPSYKLPRPQWFKKDPDFDARIANRFGAVIQDALAGRLDAWAATPLGCLALILVLDQFTRNTGRSPQGTPDARAFAGDAQALRAARQLVSAGADRAFTSVQRQFTYLPFEHAETLADQDESIRLFAQLGQDDPAQADLLTWAERHRVIVQRFGRFPHRNAALGRESTAEELAFLQEPGSGF